MTQTITPAAIRKSVQVHAGIDRAFAIFTAGIGRWWPAAHSIGTAPQQNVVMEPRAGGRLYECGADGSECDWGKVLLWEPPHRLILAWQLTAQWRYDADFMTEVEVRFIAEGDKVTRVELEHRNLERYGAAQEAVTKSIDSPEGWTGLLQLYAKAAAA